MKQVMVITNPHPILIQELVSSLYDIFSGCDDVLVLSAQAVSLILESSKGIDYNISFDQTIKVTEKNIDSIIKEKKIRYLVIVGTLERKELERFDVILGFQEKYDDGTPVYSDWPAPSVLDIMTLKDADGIIENHAELNRFLLKLYKMLTGDKK